MRPHFWKIGVAAVLATAAVIATIVEASSAALTASADIVFLRGIFRLWVMQADGTHQRQLTNVVSGFPQWSPNRRWIAYTYGDFSRPAASQEVWLMHSDGSSRHQLTHVYPAQTVGLSWSPDGTQIAYARDAKPPGGIWVVNVDGSGATAITNDQADGTPAWAPDGKHFLFTKQCCSASGPQWKQPSTLFIVSANGNNEHRFLKLPAYGCGDQNPSWSPNGTSVAFARCIYVGPPPAGEGERPQRLDIWIVQASGQGLHRILKNGGEPSWSPDGQWIVFSRTAAKGDTFSSLYKMHPNGTGVVRLTRDPRGDQAPDW